MMRCGGLAARMASSPASLLAPYTDKGPVTSFSRRGRSPEDNVPNFSHFRE